MMLQQSVSLISFLVYMGTTYDGFHGMILKTKKKKKKKSK